MKILFTVTLLIVVTGLVSSVLIAGHYSTNVIQLVWIPFAVLIGLLIFVKVQNRSIASQISLFISACVTGLMSTSAYYGVSYGTSHSSTEALIFFVVPVYVIGLIPVIYGVVRLVPITIKFVREIAE